MMFVWWACTATDAIVVTSATIDPPAPLTTDDSLTTTDVPPNPTDVPPPVVAEPSLLINEFVASNVSGLLDDEGEAADWIELVNVSDSPITLSDWSLSDDEEKDGDALSGTLEAGALLVLYADGETALGSMHLGFELGKDGGDLALWHNGALVQHLPYGPLIADLAVARQADGHPDFVLGVPSPGVSQGPADLVDDRPTVPMASGCGPTWGLTDPYTMETEPVVGSVACTSGLLADFEARLASTLPGPALADGALSWTPGTDGAGRYDLLVAVEPSDHVGIPETAVTTQWVADAWRDPGNVLVDPLSYHEEYGLPVLHLDPDGPVDQYYSPMRAWYKGTELAGQIKIRGAASAGYTKPSYTLEFDPIQIDLGDIGLQNKDHLVVISNFDDVSYVRQMLVYEAWAAMALTDPEGRLVPRTAFMVIYLNGVYQGLFTAVDHVDDEFLREMGFDDSGDLFKSVSHDANFYLTNAAGGAKAPLSLGWEKKEGEPIDDFAPIEALTDFTGSATHAEFDAEADIWLSRLEFMDWFALVHWMAADDSGGKNAYLYEDPLDGRFRYTPWDFNHALGQNWYTARFGPEVYNDFIWTNAVFWHMQDDPPQADALWARLKEHRGDGGALDDARILEVTAAAYAEIEPSCARDWQKWESAYWDYFGWAHPDEYEWEEERAWTEDWIADRDLWMTYYHGAP